jgi:hypothetical protein
MAIGLDSFNKYNYLQSEPTSSLFFKPHNSLNVGLCSIPHVFCLSTYEKKKVRENYEYIEVAISASTFYMHSPCNKEVRGLLFACGEEDQEMVSTLIHPYEL